MLSAGTLLKHIGLAGLGPASIVALYFTPVATFGCVNRGLMAIGVVLFCTIASAVSTWRGARLARRDPMRPLWLLSAAILLFPAALLLGPLR